jgi:hypothetical protein
MSWMEPWTWADDSQGQKDQRADMIRLGQNSEAFAARGVNNYGDLTGLGRGSLQQLGQQAQGQRSVSAEQLRQALGQNQAAQMSLAAGASPRNAAMAARTAAIQTGRLGAGLAGQQAVAGLQEQNQAQQQYAALLQGLRQQDLQAALGSQQNALSAYGGYKPEGSFIDKWGQPIAAGFGAAVKKG